ncbi:MAG: methyltransferase domain-containing protein [Elainellaceae cyanobacterium]
MIKPAYRDPIQTEYAQLAHRYDRRWSFYVEATIAETLKRMQLRGEDRVLDLGCGTGTLIHRLLARAPAAQVTGVDTCAEMLQMAQKKLPKTVALRVGSAEGLPLADSTVDVVVSTSAFHYFRNPQRALGEIRRVLRPGGQVVITDWCHDYLTCQICDLLLRFNRAHVRAYSGAECQTMLQGSGLQNIAIARYKINWLWGMMTASAVNPDSDGPGTR